MSVDGDAAVALAGFGINEVERLERLPAGIKNVNHRVRADGADWVLKRHPSGVDTAQLERVHAFEHRLAAVGFPVARLRQTTTGGTWLTTPAGVFTMYAWVEGRHVRIDGREQAYAAQPQLARQLGVLVGSLHREGELGPGADPASGADRLEGLLAGPGRTVASIRHGRPHRFRKVARVRRRPRTSLDDWILAHLSGLFREARRLTSPRVAGLVDPADTVLAHHDLNWENLVLGDDLDVRAVLDFDNATVLPRALDLGAAAAVLVGSRPERLEEFLMAYADVAGRDVDLRAVRVGMRWKCVRSMLWSVDAYASGRVADPAMLEVWCRHLHECLTGLPDERG